MSSAPAESTAPDPPARALTPPPVRRFAPNHPWDRNFFLGMAGLAWLGILVGFGGDIFQHLSGHKPAYAPIVHVHAAVFVLWLVLFTVQVLLIRSRRLQLHKRLGFGLAGLAAVMVILGPATALTVQHLSLGDPQAHTAFLAVQFIDLLAFAGLTGSAIVLRNNPAAHKRLILIGTLYITDAGFSRWLADPIIGILGEGFWGLWACLFLPVDFLILLVSAYDFATRRRVHPASLAGLGYALGLQMIAVTVYLSPGWIPLSKGMAAAWPW